ncbi:MAG: hypothetical protein R3B95_15090 [Nitrospirales bacterium]|nr:hypothetical protein [Nitrospirales bacterium]
MSDLIKTVQGWWDHMKSGEAKTRAHFSIDRSHADIGVILGPPFDAKQHYFQVIVHEMFLANDREWFVDYDPMVVAAASYQYDTNVETVPFVAGPSMLKDFGHETPRGMIFRDTPVSGLNPYQGGAFTLTLVLYKVQRKNNADRLLRVVEGISKSLDPSNALAAYLKVAGTIVDGVEAILGLDETVPVLGYRVTMNPQINQDMTPDYWVLIDDDSAAETMKPERFRVRKSRLYHVDGQGVEKEYRDHDFVLFRIAQGNKRSDERTLPFFPLWTAAKDFAARADDEFWKEAKAHFNTLKRNLLSSPDLTTPDSARLRKEYLEELKNLRKESVEESLLTSGSELLSEAEKELRRMGKELDKLDNL